MELKWLEDLVAVAEKGHFMRASEERAVTQSALSRRIKSLELWVGTELFDRSVHPVTLTPAGLEFLPIARDMIQQAYSARSIAREYNRIAETGITISCLHTLSLFLVPKFVAELRNKVGNFETTIIAETRTIEECLDGLYTGTSDFFICYKHQDTALKIDPTFFPNIEIGQDKLLPYYLRKDDGFDLDIENDKVLPYIEYAGTSYISRIVDRVIDQFPYKDKLSPVYRGTLAESLCTAVMQGLGMAWLPKSIVEDNPRAGNLICLGEEWGAELSILMYSASSNNRPVVERILEHSGPRHL